MNGIYNTFKKKFNKSIVFEENLSKYNWFNLGGPADIFFRPENKIQLIEFLMEAKKNDFAINILGAGSNTLIRDSGVRGAVLKLSSNFSNLKLIDNDKIVVGAATLDRKVSDFAKDHSIGGLEFLSCIPGSIGGAIVMNSGCYGNDISKILDSIKIINLNGEEKEIKKKDIDFFYRSTSLPKNYIIIEATFKGYLTKKSLIEEKQSNFISKKKLDQPSRVKTGGSTFKNHTNKKAWELIKQSGCDKFKIGEAKISDKHCNFLVNDGNAKASDMEKLISKIRDQVKSKTGINLDLEIKILGDEI